MSLRSWSSVACAALVASLSVACASGGDAAQIGGDDGGELDDSATQPPVEAGADAKTGRDAGGSSDATAADTQPDEEGDSSSATDTGSAVTDTGTTVVDSGGGGPESSTSTCNAQNCASGCCQGNNCVAGTSNSACGLTGAVCADCTTIPSATCVSGVCEAPSSNCSSTCAGCCDSNNVCHATSSAQYCFTNGGNPFTPGSACEDCVSEGDLFCIQVIIAYACSPIP
jgi:hypothetical protein